MRHELRVLNARAAIKQLEIKVMEREEDVKRLRDHIALQEAEIVKAESELSKLAGD
jgi:multidrug resistance efflux pump